MATSLATQRRLTLEANDNVAGKDNVRTTLKRKEEGKRTCNWLHSCTLAPGNILWTIQKRYKNESQAITVKAKTCSFLDYIQVGFCPRLVFKGEVDYSST